MDVKQSLLRHKMRIAALCFTVTSLFSAAAAAWQPINIDDDSVLRSPPSIAVRNGTLFFDGEIVKGSAAALHQQLEMRRVEKVSFNSMGGDVKEAMAMGREIHRRKVDVEVRNVCASACANYIFPAGKNKFVTQNAYLLWHGSLHSPAADIATVSGGKDHAPGELVASPEFIALKEQETQFYQQIGVSSDMPWCPQRQADYREKFPEKWFSWSQANLARFGVNHVRFATGAARWQSTMSDRGVIFAEYCRSS
ncbi:hypothetical protein AAFN90_07400 [Erwiniaceae bacterium CAU 1747]